MVSNGGQVDIKHKAQSPHALAPDVTYVHEILDGFVYSSAQALYRDALV